MQESFITVVSIISVIAVFLLYEIKKTLEGILYSMGKIHNILVLNQFGLGSKENCI